LTRSDAGRIFSLYGHEPAEKETTEMPVIETRTSKFEIREIARCGVRKCPAIASRLVRKTRESEFAVNPGGGFGSWSSRIVDVEVLEGPAKWSLSCGHGSAIVKSVEGRHSEVRACDVRCTSAKGHKCECSCSGTMHGADHVPAE
jgi:hypothetical protein